MNKQPSFVLFFFLITITLLFDSVEIFYKISETKRYKEIYLLSRALNYELLLKTEYNYLKKKSVRFTEEIKNYQFLMKLSHILYYSFFTFIIFAYLYIKCVIKYDKKEKSRICIYLEVICMILCSFLGLFTCYIFIIRIYMIKGEEMMDLKFSLNSDDDDFQFRNIICIIFDIIKFINLLLIWLVHDIYNDYLFDSYKKVENSFENKRIEEKKSNFQKTEKKES